MDLIKARLAWVELYAKTGDAGLVCRRCGISRPTLRKWWRRYQADGEAGLVEHSRRPHLLSRSPKVLQQLSEPEAFGHHASLAARLLRRQPQNPISGLGGQSIDGRGLSVGRDQPLELAPELIHRAQFGRLPGQPHEPDAQPVGQGLGLRGGVGAGPVGEQPEPAGAAVAAPQRAQERLSIGLTGTGADQRHPASAAQVNHPKQHPLGVAPGDRHEGLRALERPGRPQRRKQPQQRPVEAQQPITPVPAGLQASGDPPFFCDR
jgi:transposase-like protein